MTRRPALARRVAVLAAVIAAGCGSSPEPVYSALSPGAGARQPAPARVLVVRRPTIAGYLDRDPIVGLVEGYRLVVLRGERWAEPLAAMLGRVLAEELSERLPDSTVVTEEAEIGAEPDAVVNVDVQRFDAGPDGEVVARAQVMLEIGHGHPRTLSRSLELAARPAAGGTPALVATMSALLGRLADAISDMLRDV